MRRRRRAPLLALLTGYALATALMGALLVVQFVPGPSGSLPGGGGPTLPPVTAPPEPTAVPSATPVPRPVQVLRTYPIHGDSDVQADVPLSIVFDQPMDPAPGSISFTLSPGQPLEAEWTAPDHLLLQGGRWQPGTAYELTLETARSRDGGELEAPLTLAFSAGGLGAPIPILMYHNVKTLTGPLGPNGKECAVSPAEFAAQLDLFAEFHAHVVPLGDVVAYLAHGAPLAARPVVLTFDDTGENAYRVAAPILYKRGLTATFFVISGYVGVGSPHYTGWDELCELAEQGFTLASHSHSHPPCAGLSAAAAKRELAGSRRLIEQETGQEVRFFAYPYGVHTSGTIRLLEGYGYQAAVSIGPNVYQSRSRLMALSRIFMAYGDPLDKLRRYVAAWEEPLPGSP